MKPFWTLLFAVTFGLAIAGCEGDGVEQEGVVPEGEVVEPIAPEREVEVEEPDAGIGMPATEEPTVTPPAGDAAVEEEPVTNPPPELKEEAQE